MTSERVKAFLASIKPEEEYNSFLKGKRVAIIGPSKHILLEKNGAKIDDYDVVIRLKWLPMKGFNAFKDFVGDETHVVYSSAKNYQSDFEVLIQAGVKYTRHPECSSSATTENRVLNGVTSMSYPAEDYAIILEEYAKENGYTNSKVQNINSKKSRYNIWPQLGFNAIMDTVASDVEEVYITGFTMYHGGGHMLQKNKPAHHNNAIVEKHNGLLEILMLIDILNHVDESDKKVVLDPILSRILNAYKSAESEDASPHERFKSHTSILCDLTNEINNLVKDL